MKTLSFYKNKQQSLFVILLTLFLMIFSFYGCNEITEPTMENTNHSELSKMKIDNYETIKIIAKGLSVFLKQENNRKELRKLLDNSKYSENIIESSEFLNDNKEKIAHLLSTKEKTSFLGKVKTVKFGQYDIYFPEKKWRDNWKSTDELYIAAIGFREEDNKDDILAFDIKGNEIHLSSQEKPSIPTLVVYPSEKRGNYGILLPTSGISKKIKPTAIQSNYYKAKSIRYFIENDHDPAWWLGNMEIYFYVSSRAINSSVWSGWTKIYMDQNTVAGTWTEYEKTIVSRSTNFIYTFKVMEEDNWLDPDDLVAGNTWNSLWDPTFTYIIYGSPISTHATNSGSPAVGWQDLVSNKLTEVRIDYSYPPPPDPLAMTISGPTTLFGSPNNSYNNTSNIKSKGNSVLAPVESATGTWTANATGGSGSYSYQWYSRSSPTYGWYNTGVTTQNYTKTIYDDIEFKCIVTSGSETVSDEIAVDFVPSGGGEF